MLSVKNPNCVRFVQAFWLQRRVRRELSHLKGEHERLRLAMLQVDQAKAAIDRWTRND